MTQKQGLRRKVKIDIFKTGSEDQKSEVWGLNMGVFWEVPEMEIAPKSILD